MVDAVIAVIMLIAAFWNGQPIYAVAAGLFEIASVMYGPGDKKE